MERLIPYAPDVYLGMIADYNVAAWPGQLIAIALCWLIVISARRGGATNARTAILVAAGFWIWTGYAFQIETHATLNWAATWFGYGYIVQGVLMAVWAFSSSDLEIALSGSKRRLTGVLLLLAAVALHPLMVFALGAPLGFAQTVGYMPMPTVLATLAIYALIAPTPPVWLLILPLVASIWEGLSAWTLGLANDLNLPIVALGALLYLALKKDEETGETTGA